MKLFETALGGWDLSVYFIDYSGHSTSTIIYYDGSGNEKIKLGTMPSKFAHPKPTPYYEYQFSGVIYHVVFLIINGLILVNLVVAIMSDTYARLMDVKNGIYFSGVIQAMTVYKSDKKYGAIISLIPPFNIFVVPFLPCFIATTKPQRLTAYNSVVMKIFYFPVVVVTLVFFTVTNIALIPIAWLYSLLHKIVILVRVRSCAAFGELILYLTLGLLFHVISIFLDMYRFFVFSYDETQTRVVKLNYGTNITKYAFDSVRTAIEADCKDGKQNRFA